MYTHKTHTYTIFTHALTYKVVHILSCAHKEWSTHACPHTFPKIQAVYTYTGDMLHAEQVKEDGEVEEEGADQAISPPAANAPSSPSDRAGLATAKDEQQPQGNEKVEPSLVQGANGGKEEQDVDMKVGAACSEQEEQAEPAGQEQPGAEGVSVAESVGAVVHAPAAKEEDEAVAEEHGVQPAAGIEEVHPAVAAAEEVEEEEDREVTQQVAAEPEPMVEEPDAAHQVEEQAALTGEAMEMDVVSEVGLTARIVVCAHACVRKYVCTYVCAPVFPVLQADTTFRHLMGYACMCRYQAYDNYSCGAAMVPAQRHVCMCACVSVYVKKG
jgi:hypothetical protein